MTPTKLIELINGITNEEFRKFGDFVKSPFFNKSKRIIRFYNSLKVLRKRTDYKITKESLWNYIFPGEKYDDQKIRLLISDFVKLAEKYLSYKGYTENDLNQKIILLKEYRIRDLQKNFKSLRNNILKFYQTNSYINKDDNYYYFLYFLETENLEFRGEDIVLNYEKNFDAINSATNYLFMKAKLNIVNTMIQRSWFSHEKVHAESIWPVTDIISNIEKNLEFFLKNHPLIYMDYLFLKMDSESDNLNNYKTFKRFIIKNIDKLQVQELMEKFLCLQNYLTKKIFEGGIIYRNELVSMKIEFEAKGFFDRVPVISHIIFFNTIFDCLFVNKILNAELFFNKYQNKIILECKDTVVKLCGGLIQYYKKDFEKAKKLLSEVSPINYYYYLRAKTTLVKIFYESQEYETTLYYIDSIKHYIRRNKFVIENHNHFKSFLSFTGFIGKLVKIQEGNPQKIASLRKLLEHSIQTDSKSWLQNKLAEIEQQNKPKKESC